MAICKTMRILPTFVEPMSCSIRVSAGLPLMLFRFVLWCAYLQGVSSFMPNFQRPTSGILGTSMTHKKMTERALRKMAILYMQDHPDKYPDHVAAMATRDFQQALKNFREGAVRPDLEPSLADLPSAHFNSEQIIESNSRLLEGRMKVVAAMSGGDMVAARLLAGQLLHTLQDFYSHTNWVDIGQQGENEALGEPGRDVGQVASMEQPTCLNCDTDTCSGDVRYELRRNKILTSGYMKANPHNDPSIKAEHFKPTGKDKCSHGGRLDITRTLDSRGGINKDTNSAEYSPHHYHHRKAAALAEAASLRWMQGLRAVRHEEEFGRFLGLEAGTSLCFVVDTTGSMRDEIAAVRHTTVRLTHDQRTGKHRSAEYVLVPFNDPKFGPMIKTTDPDEIIDHLRALTASGGGDTPEMAFSGILEALRGVRPGSTCHLFTDAPAKDKFLSQTANALATDKQVKVNAFYTNVSDKRRKREVGVRRKRRAFDESLRDLVRTSGGHVIRSAKSDIEEVARIVDAGMTTTQVTLLQVDNRAGTGHAFDELTVPVDESLTDLVILVTCAESRGLTVNIHDPSGTILTPGRAGSGHPLEVVVDSSSAQVLRVARPGRGLWAVLVVAASPYSLRVTASSRIDFSYKFVESVSGAHGGYRNLPGNPSAGKKTTIVVDISGGVDVLTGSHVTRGLAEVSDLVLVSEDDDELQRLALFPLEALLEYEATTVLPSLGFRLVVEGRDTRGSRVRRVDTGVVRAAACSLRVEVAPAGSYSLLPGQTLTVPVTVSNTGPAMTYDLGVSDSLGFFTELSTTSMSMRTGETQMFEAMFHTPDGVAVSEVSTVTVMVGDMYGVEMSKQNFAVFHLTTVPEQLDTIPPVCRIVNTTGQCALTKLGMKPGHQEHWGLAFTTWDTGTGIYIVKPAHAHAGATFLVDDHVTKCNDIVSGTYWADCCSPRVVIVTSDVMGNAGRCEVDHLPVPTVQPVHQAVSSTARNNMNAHKLPLLLYFLFVTWQQYTHVVR